MVRWMVLAALCAAGSRGAGRSASSGRQQLQRQCQNAGLFGLSARRMSSVSGGNGLMMQGGLPRFDAFEAGQVREGVGEALEGFQKEFAELEKELGAAKDGALTFETVVERMEKIEAPISYAWGMVSHLTSVKNSDELRKYHQEMQPKVVKVMQAVGQSEAVFRALKFVEKKEKLDPVQERIVKKSVKGMEMSGIGLAAKEREEFNNLKLRAAELSTQFSNNLLDSTKAFKLNLTTASDIEGIPETSLGMFAHAALSEGHANATAKDGPWVVTLDGPSFIAFMKYARNRELREKLYKAYVSRASSGEVDNVPLIKELIKIRQRTSELLGYKSYAERSLSVKMAESPEKVLELIAFLKDRSFGHAKKELADLEAFAQKNGHPGKLLNWDIAFWSERLKEDKYEFSQEELRPYFSLDLVLEGLFDFAERLFGIKIIPADGKTSVWHPDVRFFDVLDGSSGQYMASFYLDPYSRPGEKRGGAWMASCQDRSKVMGRKPVAYLVCNGSPPTKDKPSLMTFNEVETLWHECGHAFQHLTTKVEHAGASGINGIEWDAVEIPSQWMEEWLYDKETLYKFAKHYETGKPLPEDLFNKLVASRHFNAGMFMLRQLNFGALDMALHSQGYDPDEKNPIELQKEMAREFSVLAPLPEDHFLCSFAHIFAGGYAAGYYSYVYSRIMSSDAFGMFEEAGLHDDEKVRKLGKEFRDTILALGGGTHPAEVFRKFRGRDPSPEAFLRHSGLGPRSAL